MVFILYKHYTCRSTKHVIYSIKRVTVHWNSGAYCEKYICGTSELDIRVERSLTRAARAALSANNACWNGADERAAHHLEARRVQSLCTYSSAQTFGKQQARDERHIVRANGLAVGAYRVRSSVAVWKRTNALHCTQHSPARALLLIT